eukprot:Seg5940.2 transcript_id=Seg5940.2/GoldUCD/mRNA.D3Y31 product="hypothetical protein" protein_id=Seg5940.2/GoldUCD/D3Y31
MAELKKKRNVRGGYRAYIATLIGQIDDNLEDRIRLKQIEIQLREKQDILQNLDDGILNLVSESDQDGTGCIQEISESGATKEKIDLALLTLEDRFKPSEIPSEHWKNWTE